MESSRSIEAARTIWLSAGLPEISLSYLILNGEETSIKSSFRVTVAAQAAVGLSALSAAHLHALRARVEQSVSVNARDAVLSFSKLPRKCIKMLSNFESVDEFWYTVDGQLPQGEVWDPIAGIYATKDNGFVRIHTNFPQ
jgi:hypothetical protein